MMEMQKTKANKQTPRSGRGFSTIELLITATILTIVTAFGLMGITRAKANIRLSGAAREYASHVEKARLYSIRSHADDEAERANVAINDDKLSYNVTMDLDGDGGMDTRTISLPSGITFETVETIAFDWRGRTWNTVGALTSSNAQVSIRLKSDIESISIDVTGSGDITIDSKVFDDAVPNVNLNVGDLAAGATPVPTPDTTSTTPPTTPTNPTDPTNPTTPTDPTTPADPTDPTNPTDPTDPIDPPVDPGTTTPNPNPNPSPKPTPASTPTPAVCSITTNLPSLTLDLEGTATIKVGHSSSASLTISGSSSKPSDLQVSAPQTISAGSTGTFTIKSKKTLGIYSITFDSSCGSKTVGVVVTNVGISLGL